MGDVKKDLLLLFQRPYEPVFGVKKDEDGKKVRIEAPEDLTDRYKPIANEIQNRFGANDVDRVIPVAASKQPNLDFAKVLPRRKPFSCFIRKHMEIAGKLTKIFMDEPDLQSLQSTAVYCHDRCNPQLFNYCYSVALQHRPDTQDLPIPSIAELFPSQFLDPEAFTTAREENQFVPEGVRRPITIPLNYTATEREPEQRLAYWREDIGLNLHHWHWHLVFPSSGDARIVRKDRRGEIFFYMHTQSMFRYNIERFANKLGRVRPLTNFRETLTEGYFPKLIRSSDNTTIPPRFANSVLQDVDRPNDFTVVEVSDLERWRDRIYEAIDRGYALDTSGNQVPFDEVRGIDILGDLFEPSDLSINLGLYGELHNMGHNMLGFIHDPDGRYLENMAVIGENTTTMRDPMFYRWHGFVDYVFQRHKNTLAPYNPQTHFNYNGITVQSIQLQTNQKSSPANTLLTFWQRSEVNLGVGLDFGREGDVFAQFTHLQHAPFDYEIAVDNSSGTMRRGTCRIFMAPRVDERGTRLNFRDQRLLTIEMDRFIVNLNPGSNRVRRRSDQSSLTIPYERTFRNVGMSVRPTDAEGRARFDFCGCGWPQHLLVPKGTPEGMEFDVFVMISNYDDDTVNENYDPNDVCSDSYPFCGVRSKRYPDRRAMGFPFDRQFPTANSMADFANLCPNMALGECRVIFTNRYVTRT